MANTASQMWPTWFRWLPPALILLCGVFGTVVLSNSFEQKALDSWQSNAGRAAQWLSGTLLGWLEESYAPVSAVAALYENSNNVSDDEFFNA